MPSLVWARRGLVEDGFSWEELWGPFEFGLVELLRMVLLERGMLGRDLFSAGCEARSNSAVGTEFTADFKGLVLDESCLSDGDEATRFDFRGRSTSSFS
jgi:hypothetical protein